MKLNGFVGQAYTLPAVKANCQRSVNIYPELDESGFPKEGQIAFLKRTPGYRKIFELGSGPIRLIHVDGLENDDGTYFQLNRMFVVSGPKVYRLTFSSIGWDILELGELNTSEGPVSAASTQVDLGATVFVDGSVDNYVYHSPSAGVENFQTFDDAGYQTIERATQVRWLDGYLIFIIKDSNQFYVSSWNSLSVDPLSFATSEGNPDTIKAIEVLERAAWFFNGKTTEVWPNTGNADFPLERQAFIETGTMAAFSVAKGAGSLFWLGQDEIGRGMVMMGSGISPQRISTHAIESAIAGYESPENARGYCYQDEGHLFYVLNFDETTWVYDVSTKSWHERCYLNNGDLERDRVDTHAYFSNYGGHIGGDYQNAKVYLFDNSYNYHDSSYIKWVRSCPHISDSNKYIKFNSLEIQARVGVGLDGDSSAVGADPQMMMRFSDDGGNTWSNFRTRSMGKIGEYKTRVYWKQLGLGRDRVFEVSGSDPVPVALLSAELDAVAGSR